MSPSFPSRSWIFLHFWRCGKTSKSLAKQVLVSLGHEVVPVGNDLDSGHGCTNPNLGYSISKNFPTDFWMFCWSFTFEHCFFRLNTPSLCNFVAFSCSHLVKMTEEDSQYRATCKAETTKPTDFQSLVLLYASSFPGNQKINAKMSSSAFWSWIFKKVFWGVTRIWQIVNKNKFSVVFIYVWYDASTPYHVIVFRVHRYSWIWSKPLPTIPAKTVSKLTDASLNRSYLLLARGIFITSESASQTSGFARYIQCGHSASVIWSWEETGSALSWTLWFMKSPQLSSIKFSSVFDKRRQRYPQTLEVQ